MTTTNQPTPATATKLHAMLDDLLTPPRATPPETSTTALSATSLVEDLKEIARRSQPRLRRAPAPQPEPVALHEAVRVVPHAKSELVDLHEVVRVVPHAKSELVDLHEVVRVGPHANLGRPVGAA